MQKFKNLGLQATLLAMVLLFAATGPAYAMRDSHSEDTTTPAVTSTESTTETEHATTTSTTSSKVSRPATIAGSEHSQSTRTPAERQKSCQTHKQGLTNKFSQITTNSQKVQSRIDGVFAKAQAYQQAKNLHPANYDSLVTAASTAQAASSASIATLKSLTPTLDCNNVSVASDVAAFKTAASDTRDKLKTYRSAVKAVLKALEQAKPKTEGSN